MHSLSPYLGAAYPPAKNKAVFGWLRGICLCTEWGRIVCFFSKNHLGLAGTACAVMVRNVCCLKFFPCPHGDKHVSCTAGRDFFSAKPACPFSCIKVAKNIRHAVFCPIGCRNVFSGTWALVLTRSVWPEITMISLRKQIGCGYFPVGFRKVGAKRHTQPCRIA